MEFRGILKAFSLQDPSRLTAQKGQVHRITMENTEKNSIITLPSNSREGKP